jgi:hypothetical protein
LKDGDKFTPEATRKISELSRNYEEQKQKLVNKYLEELRGKKK